MASAIFRDLGAAVSGCEAGGRIARRLIRNQNLFGQADQKYCNADDDIDFTKSEYLVRLQSRDQLAIVDDWSGD